METHDGFDRISCLAQYFGRVDLRLYVRHRLDHRRHVDRNRSCLVAQRSGVADRSGSTLLPLSAAGSRRCEKRPNSDDGVALHSANRQKERAFMIGSWLKKASTRLLGVARQACLVAGIVLVVLATSWILVPFALGLALIAVAKWGAEREAEQSPLIVVPVGA